MKTKFIVASSIGLLGVTSMILGATTFASTTGANKIGGVGWGSKMMGNRDGMMKQFTNTGDAAAFKTLVDQATTNKDFAAFQAAHTKYTITMNITQNQFNEMIAVKSEMDAFHKKVTEALKNGDYATWKTLNKDTPLSGKIDTEAKFKKLQEMESYREKMDTIRTELGLEGPALGQGSRNKGQGMGMGFGMGNKEGNMKRGMGLRNGSGSNQ